MPLQSSHEAIRPLYSKFQKRTPLVIDEKECTGCKLCIRACLQSVLKMEPAVHRIEGELAIVYNPFLCTGCRQCEDICPNFCITVMD